MATAGYNIKLHNSLVTPIMLAGAPRRFAILNGTICAAFVLGMQAYYILPIFVLTHLVAVVLAKKDPYFFDVISRSIKKKKFYGI